MDTQSALIPLPPRGNRPTLAPTARLPPAQTCLGYRPGFEQWSCPTGTDPRRCGQPSRRPPNGQRRAVSPRPPLCGSPPQCRKTSGCARKARGLFAFSCACCAGATQARESGGKAFGVHKGTAAIVHKNPKGTLRRQAI